MQTCCVCVGVCVCHVNLLHLASCFGGRGDRVESPPIAWEGREANCKVQMCLLTQWFHNAWIILLNDIPSFSLALTHNFNPARLLLVS